MPTYLSFSAFSDFRQTDGGIAALGGRECTSPDDGLVRSPSDALEMPSFRLGGGVSELDSATTLPSA